MHGVASLPPLREVIREYDLSADKKLGQNFLLDTSITNRIAASAHITPETTVIEIGPGPGGLTRALLLAGTKHLLAIEKDTRCVAALQNIAHVADGALHITEADALKADILALIIQQGFPTQDVRIIANLPYNIATPLLFGWLEQLPHIHGMTLMFQREVAERIIAAPDTKAYGRLSVMCQWLCTIRPVMQLKPHAFVPAPKVHSTVLEFIPRKEPLAPAPYSAMETVCRIAFGQRRKMLRSSLKQLWDSPETLLKTLGINPEARAETLTIPQFCTLARALDPAK